MHPYATDSSERMRVRGALAILSVFAAWLLHQQLSFPWWVDAPSVWGLFILLHTLFDHYIWQLEWLRKAHIVAVPDLTGIWQGTGTSDYDNHQKRYEFSLEVRQTWTQILVLLKHETTRSHSTIGTILTTHGDPILAYEYLSEPGADASGTMHIHRGLTRLTLRKEKAKDVLEGDYYTGRDRKTAGVFRFERQ